MANASGLFSTTLPNILQPCLRIYRFGYDAIVTRVFCSSSDTDAARPRFINQGCKLVGSGSAVPNLKISNDDLSKIVETNDEWIFFRTGIRNRRVIAGKDTLTGLAVEAVRKALEMAQVHPDEMDLMLMCTSTPEDLFGSAPQIQKALARKNNPLAYDITAAVVGGFMLGLVSAACHIRGGFKNVLVFGADALSRYVDWTDSGTSILFGDAASAVLVQACDLHRDGEGQRQWNASITGDAKDHEPGLNNPEPNFPPYPSSYSGIQMNGKEVFRFACRVVPASIEASLKNAGYHIL